MKKKSPRVELGAGALLVCLCASLALAACQSAPRPTEAIRRSGDREFQRGNYAAAAEEYREIADRTPGDWRAQYRLGLSLLEIDRPADARDALEIANNLKPNDPDIRSALARAMHEQGATNELFAFLRQRADETRATGDYMEMARYAMLEGDYDLAEVALRTAIEVDQGQSVEPYLGMAALDKQLGRDGSALANLRRAQQINPDDRRVIERLREYETRTTQVDDQ